MSSIRWDETWHRLREWTNGQGASERLAAQILLHEGYEGLDPSHPLGGQDGGKDAICIKNGMRFAMAVYFPRGQRAFREIDTKYRIDLEAASNAGVDGFVFVTNQELRLAERRDLLGNVENRKIYHLEEVTAILDQPKMHGVRKQFLGIDPEDGVGGSGGTALVMGSRSIAVGGRGGSGGVGRGGDGGDGIVKGDDSLAIGGDGGDAGTPDGRGGRGARSPMERAGGPTKMWKYGRGGSGANDPEYDRRIGVLREIRREYLHDFPDDVTYIEAGIDQVPISWVNKRLEELGERWRITMGQGGYLMPPLHE